MKEFVAKKQEKISKLLEREYSALSYFTLQKLFRKGDIKVNEKRVKSDVQLNVGEKVKVYFDVEPTERYMPIYEDENVLVVNKYARITSDELYENLSKNKELYYIHRLDRNTNGIIIFAKNKEAEKELLNGFKKRTFKKFYLAEVYGKMPKKSDVLVDYLVKDKDKAEVKIYGKKVNGSVEIKTAYKVIKEMDKSSLLEVELITGKTHQIRAHLSYIGHFIIGDGKYGKDSINREFGEKTQRLTAYKIVLHFAENEKLYYLDNKEFTLGEN